MSATSHNDERKRQIQEQLRRIESDNAVRTAYACESGSRAWGFASQDSDYDVRFIYAHPKEWYLSIGIERERDVIELPMEDELDTSGWDLRKSLRMLMRSNPPLIEWLGSPIVYVDRWGVAAGMRDQLVHCYSPISCGYHYLSMAKANYRGYLQGKQVRMKKYFYVLRPLLAAIWIEREKGPPPMEFARLVEVLIADDSIRHEIDQLLARKRGALEVGNSETIPELNRFIEEGLEKLETSHFAKPVSASPIDRLNKFFRDALDAIWAESS